ncbi:hypothetical protein [Rhodohalobacter sp. 8-1]|uniref:hypothetical protein n=1 Tax=Rhodohalobacter sp. 8-1 TaxID=3131972 RepID=UPI0030EDDA6C
MSTADNHHTRGICAGASLCGNTHLSAACPFGGFVQSADRLMGVPNPSARPEEMPMVHEQRADGR